MYTKIKTSNCFRRRFNITNKNNNDIINKSKFSIYKLELDENETLDNVYNKILADLNDKNYVIQHYLNESGFKGFIFSKKSKPDWVDSIFELVDSSGPINVIENTSFSYIAIKEVNTNIYAIAGGHGYHLIRKYIEENFGLDLIPRLIEKGDSVVKKVSENRLAGKSISEFRVNRSKTNLNFESDFDNFYKSLEISIERPIAENLGIDISDEDNTKFKSISVTNKDSLVIDKRFSIDELNNILEAVDNVYNSEMRYYLNSFVHISKEGYKDKELFDEFIKHLVNKHNEDNSWKNCGFHIIGTSIKDYFTDYNSYGLKCNGQDIILDNDEPISLQQIYEKIPKRIRKHNNKGDSVLCSTKLKELFKYGKLYGCKDNLNVSSDLFNCLTGSLDYDDTTFYLLNGKWYLINEDIGEILSEEFKRLFEDSLEYFKDLMISLPSFKNNFKSVLDDSSNDSDNVKENDYNEKFIDDENIIYAHTHLFRKVEIADLFYYDKEKNNLYLFCIKTNHGGSESRDLFGQIDSSSRCVYECFFKSPNSSENFNKVKEYVDNVKNVNSAGFNYTTDEFLQLFKTANIYYVACFLNKFNLEMNSSYVKLLPIGSYKKLNAMNFNLLVFNLNCDHINKYLDEISD